MTSLHNLQTDRVAYLSDVAWRALAHSGSFTLPHSHKKLLAVAAFGDPPLCRAAAATVENIAEDVLDQPDDYDLDGGLS